MTTPGGTNVGTAYGKVRIDYESTGVGRAVKDVESLQNTMVDAGRTAGKTAKQIDKAQGVISQAVTSATKQLEKGLNVSAPISITPSKIELDRGAITKAISSYKDIKRSPIVISTKVKVKATDVEIDRGAITAAIESLSRDGTLAKTIKVKAPVVVETSDISINTAGIAKALSGRATDKITLTAPIEIDPSDVTINQGALSSISSQVAGAMSAGGRQGDSGGGRAGGGAATAGIAGLAARAAPAAAIGAIAAAGPAMVLGKGFQRLQGLDAAAVKLKALGKSAEEIAGISNSALKSVDKTKFGLDEAFQTAATAINANVKEGKQLDDYLKAAAGTAALAGISMQELGDQFAEAAIEGKLTGDIMQSLTARNVPVLKLLAEEYGVTQQAAGQMVSNSEVSFDRFIHAMGKNGDAAVIMGNTVGGSFDQLMASVSRTGAMLLAPLFGQATGEASTMAKAIQSITEKMKQFEVVLKRNAGNIVTVWEMAGKGVIYFGKALTSVLGWAIQGIGQLVKGVGYLEKGLGGFFDFIGNDELAQQLRDDSEEVINFGQGIFDTGSKVHSFQQTLDRGLNSLGDWANEARESAKGTGALGSAADAAKVPLVGLNEVLEKLGVKAESVHEALIGSNQEFLKMMETLEKKNASKELIDELNKMRDSFTTGGRAAESYETALENMSDTTLEASDRAGALIDSLKQLGILPGGDALSDYNEQFEQMTSYARELPNMLDALGKSLILSSGEIDTNSANGRKLKEEIESARQAMGTLAASGDVPAGEAFDRTVEQLRFRLQDYGIAGQEAEDLINKYLTGGKGKQFFEANFSGGTPKEVVEQAFAGDPAKIESILKLMTTQEDILNELLGGPGSTLKIPATVEVSQPVVGSQAGTPVLAPPPSVEPPKPSEPYVKPPGESRSKYKGGGGDFDEQVWVRLPNGDIKKVKDYNLPPGAVKLDYDPSKANIEGGKFTTDPAKDPQGTGLDLGSNEIPKDKWNPYSFNQEFQNILNDPLALNNSLSSDPATQATLQPVIADAEKSGKSVADAFAEGINSGSEEVKAAIIKLAMLVGDGLGNSPAKYGPLSGSGYSLFRGKAVTKAFAEGIVSESNAAQVAVSSMASTATVPFGQKMETMVKDLAELSGLSKSIFDFGKSLADIGFSAARMANDLSGGRLFPKSYIKDPDRKAAGSALPGWNPTRNPTPGAPFSIGSPGGPVSAPGELGANPGKQQIADYIINKALSEGYSRDQANQVLTQAVGESGLDPKISGGVQGVDEVVGIFQEMKAFSGGLSREDRMDATKNIDAYFNQMRAKGGPAAFTNPADFLGRKVSVGGPYHPENQAKGHLSNAQAAAQQFIAGYGGSPIAPTGTLDTTSLATPSTGLQMKDIGNGFYKSGSKVYRNVGGKYYDVTKLDVNVDGTPKLDKNGAPLAIGTPKPQTAAASSALAGVNFSDTSGINIAGANPQIMMAAQIARDMFGLEMTSGNSNHSQDKGWHPKSQAGDFSNSQGNSPEQAAFAKFMKENFGQIVEQIIYSDPSVPGVSMLGGKPFDYGSSTNAQHENHVHLAIKDGMSQAFSDAIQAGGGAGIPQMAFGSSQEALGTPQNPLSVTSDGLGTPTLPPGLAEFSDLFSTSPKNAQEATAWLQSIDGHIADQNRLGTPESKAKADALGVARSQTMNSFGLSEGPTGLDQAQGIFNGIAGVTGDVMAVVDASIASIGAASDISQRAVRGVANTKDIMDTVDNIQTFIDLGAKIAQTVSSVTGLAGQIAGASGGTDGGAASGALSAVSGIAGIVSAGYQAVNAGIDVAQEVISIVGKYTGRFMTSWFGLPGASDMKFLLDEMTGQMMAYTSDNPQMKHTFNTMGRSLGKEYPGRPSPTNNFTIYQGPGQDPRDTMDDAMFTVRSSGVGAFGYAE